MAVSTSPSVHVEMGHGPENVLRDREREENAVGPEAREGLVARQTESARVEEDEVRLDRLDVDRQSGSDQPLGEPTRVCVVVREALDVVLERVEPGGGDDAGLAHRASEHVLEAPGLRLALGRGCENGAEGAAEALREAERHRVELAPEVSAAGTPLATDAFMSRAPSRCTASPCAAPRLTTARSCPSGQTRPPPPLCVFSTQTIRLGAAWRSPGGLIRSATSSGPNVPSAV